MDRETYLTIPQTLTVRELKVRVDITGFRVRELIVVTTLTDATRCPREEIARLFRLRWHVELDLRNIKTSLRLDDLRGKKPETIRREIWVHWLAYNLLRKVMAQAALTHEKLPRELSFVAALAAVSGARRWPAWPMPQRSPGTPRRNTMVSPGSVSGIAQTVSSHGPSNAVRSRINFYSRHERKLRETACGALLTSLVSQTLLSFDEEVSARLRSYGECLGLLNVISADPDHSLRAS